MRIPYRPLAIGLVTLAFSALVLARAQTLATAISSRGSRSVVKGGSGSCHLALRPRCSRHDHGSA